MITDMTLVRLIATVRGTESEKETENGNEKETENETENETETETETETEKETEKETETGCFLYLIILITFPTLVNILSTFRHTTNRHILYHRLPCFRLRLPTILISTTLSMTIRTTLVSSIHLKGKDSIASTATGFQLPQTIPQGPPSEHPHTILQTRGESPLLLWCPPEIVIPVTVVSLTLRLSL